MVSECLWHQSSPYLNPSHRSLWQRHREVVIAFGCSGARAGCRQLSWCAGFGERAGKRRAVIAAVPLFTSLMRLQQLHFLWTSLKVCCYFLLTWIIHYLWMMVIGVWLSQAGLLYPLSSGCFGMLEDSSYFSQHLFLMFIILLDVKTFWSM